MGLTENISTSSMKIDVIGTRGFPGIQGGVERHCERLYPCMENVEIRVFRRKPYVNHNYPKNFYQHITFCDYPSTRISGLEAVAHSFLATATAAFSKADVVHVHNIGPAMFTPLLRIFGKKVVLTYHSANYEHDKWNAVAKAVLRLSEKIALGAANRVIFVNKFQMQKYSEKIQRKSCYIPNGVAPLALSTSTSFLESLKIEPGKYLLSVGRITPEKGFDLLIKAYNGITTDKKLVIAGAPDQGSGHLDELKALANGNPNIIFAGFADGDNLAQLYTNAAAYILSSRIEGFPLVLLEAISFNLPLLVSDIEATHLLDLPCQSYFKASDADSLCEKLKDFLTSSPEAFRCSTVNVADYSWTNIAAQVREVFADTLK